MNQPNLKSTDSQRQNLAFSIIEEQELLRPAGYVIPGFSALSVKISFDGHDSIGFGEGKGSAAKEKALSEAVERAALKSFRLARGVPESSNGWSCHYLASLAVENAIFELIERDVALTAWQNGGPFYLVPEGLWPEVLNEWKSTLSPHLEFSDLKLFLSESKNGACISALLFNDKGNFVAGHASGSSLHAAILSATAECFRAAHAAIRFEHFSEVIALHSKNPTLKIEPGAHSLAYAYSETLPKTIKIVTARRNAILEKWEHHLNSYALLNQSDFQIILFPMGERVVARVKNEKYKQIYWGQDPTGFQSQNNNPHFVG